MDVRLVYDRPRLTTAMPLTVRGSTEWLKDNIEEFG